MNNYIYLLNTYDNDEFVSIGTGIGNTIQELVGKIGETHELLPIKGEACF